jgi:hypothetical protein
MRQSVRETAYYVNARLGCVALIARGLRVPTGMWIRIADGSTPAPDIEDLVPELFPALRGRPLQFVKLLTEFDSEAFESALPDPR